MRVSNARCYKCISWLRLLGFTLRNFTWTDHLHTNHKTLATMTPVMIKHGCMSKNSFTNLFERTLITYPGITWNVGMQYCDEHKSSRGQTVILINSTLLLFMYILAYHVGYKVSNMNPGISLARFPPGV